MAAPRLHLTAARSGFSEDEEVEVLQRNVQDGEEGQAANMSRSSANSLNGQRSGENTNFEDDRSSSTRHSETSTPEAETTNVCFAPLFASTTSDVVLDHREAYDRLNGLPESSSATRLSSQRTASTPVDNGPERGSIFNTTTPSRAYGPVQSTDDEIRQALRWHFLDPMEKYRTTRRFPWKLSLQIVKILIVTLQLVIFGDMRMGHATFASKTQTALRHLILKDWAPERDLQIYPAPVPPFAIYQMDDFYKHVEHAIKMYYLVPEVAVGTFGHDCFDKSTPRYGFNEEICTAPPVQLCIESFHTAESEWINKTYNFDMSTDTICLSVDLEGHLWNESDFSILDYLAKHNVTIYRDRFVTASISFRLKTIHLKRLQPAGDPDCFRLNVLVMYDNSDHTGDIQVVLTTNSGVINCEGKIRYPMYNVAISILIALLDTLVLIVCIASFVLCARALYRARTLYVKTNNFFSIFRGHPLCRDDSLQFINLWYILILVNDVCLILGTVFKFSIQYGHFDASLFTATGMLLGVGTLIVWLGILRYLAFFPKYNILIITLKRSLPNVLRFMLCAGLLYVGFTFCGWVVLGPYHTKFRTLMMTSECLFSLLNGDDMFATFSTTSLDSQAILWFGRLYMYLFITLFTYVVLSLFISIIMEAYEVIKDRHQYAKEVSELETFMGKSLEVGITGCHVPDTPTAETGCSSRLFRRHLSRQRSAHGEDGTQTAAYARFENDSGVESRADIA